MITTETLLRKISSLEREKVALTDADSCDYEAIIRLFDQIAVLLEILLHENQT